MGGREEGRGQREPRRQTGNRERVLQGWRLWDTLTHNPPRPPRSIWIVANTAGYEEGRSLGHSFSCVGAKVQKEGDRERPLGLGT